MSASSYFLHQIFYPGFYPFLITTKQLDHKQIKAPHHGLDPSTNFSRTSTDFTKDSLLKQADFTGAFA